jgi:hypothetical protein
MKIETNPTCNTGIQVAVIEDDMDQRSRADCDSTVTTQVECEFGDVVVSYVDPHNRDEFIFSPAEARKTAVALLKAADLAENQRAKVTGGPSAHDKAPQTYGGGGDDL